MSSSRAGHAAEVVAVEAALTTLVRRARLPNAHAGVAGAAGVAVDRAAYVVLNRIGEWGPVRLSELADRLAVDLSTVSRHVHRLEGDGYVERADDPADGRACLMSLTPAGVEAVERIRVARRDRVEQLLAGWPTQDRRELARLLDRLVVSLTRGETP